MPEFLRRRRPAAAAPVQRRLLPIVNREDVAAVAGENVPARDLIAVAVAGIAEKLYQPGRRKFEQLQPIDAAGVDVWIQLIHGRGLPIGYGSISFTEKGASDLDRHSTFINNKDFIVPDRQDTIRQERRVGDRQMEQPR